MGTGSTTGTKLIIVGDWSKYAIVDRLGTTADFLMVGTNVFDASTSQYVRSDALWVTKPAAG